MIPVPDFEDVLSVRTCFETSSDIESNNARYRHVIYDILRKILPEDFFAKGSDKTCLQDYQKRILKQIIPLVSCTQLKHFSGTVSFFALSYYCQNSFKFFFEMISRWLVPGKRLDVVLVYASDFRLPELSDHIYTVCEVTVHVNSAEEAREIERHFPFIGAEISLGIHSVFYAQRILEMKGVSVDEKTALVHAFIAFLLKRFPEVYGVDVFTEMQHVLVMCREDFKAARNARHLSRIIGIRYLIRKSLRESLKKHAQRRHFSLKIFRATLSMPQGNKRVLAVLVGLNLLKDQESFGEKHLLKAIQQYIPTVQPVEHSFFINKLPSEPISVLYMEAVKKDGSDFTAQEIKKLRRVLPSDLKNRVEHKLHPIFMPRNEEELMRNVLNLADQIKFVRDLPQVMISFDEQTATHLFFTVILVRLRKNETPPLAELFNKAETIVEYIPDRIKILGAVRKKYAKEATIFHLKLVKDIFLRADHSIDLFKARQTLMWEISRIVGEVRDYNGGLISKQHEVLSAVRQLLPDGKEYNELLLENFFYSLSPVVVRALLDPKVFSVLFMMLSEGIKEYKQEGCYLKFHTENGVLFAVVIVEDPQIKEALNKAVGKLCMNAQELAAATAKSAGNICLGYICSTSLQERKELFRKTLQDVLNSFFLLSPFGNS